MALTSEMRRLTQSFVQAFDDRVAQVTDIRDNTAQELSGFHKEHARMSAEQRKRLADSTSTLRKNVSNMMRTMDSNHHRMAIDLNKQLTAGRMRLASDVSAMRGSTQADQGDARKVWTSFNKLMQKRRAQKFTAAPTKPTVKTSAPKTSTADDLTTISGIGPDRQKNLKKMGITTFGQLAGATPTQIRKGLGTYGNLANVEQWIKEAKTRKK